MIYLEFGVDLECSHEAQGQSERGPFLVALNAKKEAFNDLENRGKETCNARNRLIERSREING